MLAGGTVAMLTCSAVQHLVDSPWGFKPPLLGHLARHHMVPCSCDSTCLFDLWSGPDKGTNKSQQTISLSERLQMVCGYKNYFFPQVHRAIFTSNGINMIFCHLMRWVPHTLISLRQACHWRVNGVISACVWILFAAGHIHLMSLISCLKTQRCNTRLRISEGEWWCT